MEGAAVTTSRIPATMSRVRLMGRWKKTAASPLESSSACRKFSSIIGPGTKPGALPWCAAAHCLSRPRHFTSPMSFATDRYAFFRSSMNAGILS
jgi:hypothetical protein